MNTQTLQIFVTLAKTKNISQAARLLYMAQSTVSTQLKSIEEELGFRLFERQKGNSPLILTEQGRYFLDIASKMLELYRDGIALKEMEQGTLSFASVDTLNVYTFSPFFNHFAQTHRDIRTQIYTLNSNEILDMMEAMVVDYGIVLKAEKRDGLIFEPYFQEKLYIAMKKKSPHTNEIQCISPSELDFSMEICCWMGDSYLNWRSLWTTNFPYGHIRVWTLPLLLQLLRQDGLWGTVPESALPEIMKNNDIAIYTLTTPPPDKIAYKVKSKRPKKGKEKMIELFEKEMDHYIKKRGFTLLHGDRTPE